MNYTKVTADDIAQMPDLADWRVLLKTLRAEFRLASYPAATQLAVGIGRIAEAADHHPDIDIRYRGRVRVALTTHATGGLSTLDASVAREISALAAEMGATSSPFTTDLLEIALDTMDASRIKQFWAAVLGYVERDGILVDPNRVGPPMWFQTMDEPRTERGRFHLDISVAHDQAYERVQAALACGGTLINDENARSWWVLADADGNEACISTWADR